MTTKIQLSAAEQQLMCDAGVILTKNAVLEKMRLLLEGVQQRQTEAQKGFETFLPPEVFRTSPKIARGENYGGLPWLMLDYPRLFTPTDTFAIRTFFWWGRFFSCTLQLSGIYRAPFQQKLQKAFDLLAPQHYIGTGPDAWQHHFEPENYTPISQLGQKGFETFLTGQPHIKIAARLPLEDWPNAEEGLYRHWQLYLNILSA